MLHVCTLTRVPRRQVVHDTPHLIFVRGQAGRPQTPSPFERFRHHEELPRCPGGGGATSLFEASLIRHSCMQRLRRPRWPHGPDGPARYSTQYGFLATGQLVGMRGWGTRATQHVPGSKPLNCGRASRETAAQKQNPSANLCLLPQGSGCQAAAGTGGTEAHAFRAKPY